MASTFSVSDLVQLALDQGFPRADAAKAGAIAYAESGGNPNAKHKNLNGSTDYGLWQINSVHADLLAKYGGGWSQPYANASMALEIYKGAGNSFKPWVTYKTGAYIPFMVAANAKAKTAKDNSKGTQGTHGLPGLPGAVVPDAITNPLMALLKPLTLLSSVEFWQRAGMLGLGVIMLTIGIVFFLARSDAGKAAITGATGAAKKAATVAAVA